MKSSIGHALEITLFGESHSETIGAVVNGLAPGIKLDIAPRKRQNLDPAARSGCGSLCKRPVQRLYHGHTALPYD